MDIFTRYVISEAVSAMTGVDSMSLDVEYAKAVESGDTAKAERMVRDAAAWKMPDTKAVDGDGLPIAVYRSCNNEYTVFDPDKLRGDVAGTGFWFTDKKAAESYSENGATRSFFLNMPNMFTTSAGECEWDDIDDGWIVVDEDGNEHYFEKIGDAWKFIDENDLDRGDVVRRTTTTNDIARKARKSGYDGALIQCVVDSGRYGDRNWQDQYVTFSPFQIKSAEVTYDDSGNLIPLSKRFDFSNPDIRY